MISLRLLLLVGLSVGLLLTGAVLADTYPKNSAVDVQHYRFELDLEELRTEIVGRAIIDARFLEAGLGEWSLDFVSKDHDSGLGMTVESVSLLRTERDPIPLEFDHTGNRLKIVFGQAPEQHQLVRVMVEYQGVPADGLGIEPNPHGHWSWFSDNWPNRARHWLPTVDHPYDKATSEMVVTAPARYQAVSNGLLVEETDQADGKRRTHWRQSVPVATWLFTLGVSQFAVQSLTSFDGKPVQTWVFAEDRDEGFYDFAEPTHHALEFYSDKVGPFSYEKLANIQSNRVRGGMEAASAIMYDARSVTGQRSKRWRNVVIHEIAHQWFGNAVTQDDWNDVWLSEGFATYFTLLFVEHAYGRDEFVQGLKESRQRIFDFYDKQPDYRIIHSNLDDMKQVTTGNTYQKGAWTLHMLRNLVGDELFWSGIQRYYALYRDRNCRTADFRRVMEQVSGLDLGWFFDQWLRQGSNLVLEWSWRFEGDGLVVDLEQAQAQDADFRAPVEIEIRFADAPPQRVTIWLEGRGTVSKRIEVPERPTEVELDPETRLLFRSGSGAAAR